MTYNEPSIARLFCKDIYEIVIWRSGGAAVRDRTADLTPTKGALYQLSYSSKNAGLTMTPPDDITVASATLLWYCLLFSDDVSECQPCLNRIVTMPV